MLRSKQFTGNENHAVTAVEGIGFIKNFRERAGAEAVPGGFFDKQAVQPHLDQSASVGMRYYYGLTDAGSPKLLLVGANADRDDLIAGVPVKVSMPYPPLNDHGLYDPAKVNHKISLKEAAKLTSNYRRRKPANGLTKGGFFGKVAVQNVLDQPGVVGLRYYFGLDQNDVQVLVMLGVDQFGSEMFYGQLIERSSLCPPFCGAANLLNGGIYAVDKFEAVLENVAADTYIRLAA